MNLNPTPTERLLMALLQLHPHSTERELYVLSGSTAPKYIRASIRALLLAGKVRETATPTGVTYSAAE